MISPVLGKVLGHVFKTTLCPLRLLWKEQSFSFLVGRMQIFPSKRKFTPPLLFFPVRPVVLLRREIVIQKTFLLSSE